LTDTTDTHDQAVALGMMIIQRKPEGMSAYEAVQMFQHRTPDFTALVTAFNKATAALPAVANGHHLQSTCAKWALDEAQHLIDLPFETIEQRVAFYTQRAALPAYAYLMADDQGYKARIEPTIAKVKACLEDRNHIGARFHLSLLEDVFQEMVDRHDDLVSDGYP
jgi:hypothetical protein